MRLIIKPSLQNQTKPVDILVSYNNINNCDSQLFSLLSRPSHSQRYQFNFLMSCKLDQLNHRKRDDDIVKQQARTMKMSNEGTTLLGIGNILNQQQQARKRRN